MSTFCVLCTQKDVAERIISELKSTLSGFVNTGTPMTIYEVSSNFPNFDVNTSIFQVTNVLKNFYGKFKSTVHLMFKTVNILVLRFLNLC